MLAVGLVAEKKTLYVAFRGTSSWDDAVTDMDIKLGTKDALPGGLFHSGFNKRAGQLPSQLILHCAKEEG